MLCGLMRRRGGGGGARESPAQPRHQPGTARQPACTRWAPIRYTGHAFNPLAQVNPGLGDRAYSDLEVVKELRAMSNAARKRAKVAPRAAGARCAWRLGARPRACRWRAARLAVAPLRKSKPSFLTASLTAPADCCPACVPPSPHTHNR